MKTQFASDIGDPIPIWARHRVAGEAWLISFYHLTEVETGFGVFYVEPFALAISLELFVKALVGYLDPSFNAKKARHGTAKIIMQNTHIPTLGAIAADAELMELIEEYGKATDIKYGEL